MAQFVFRCNITDKHGNPLIGVEVEAIDVNLFTTTSRDPISHVVALATTDDSGTATFTGLTPGMYYARPRLTRPDIRIQVMTPSGMGGGKMCYAALVNPVAGIGTHTTIQSAITALGTSGGLIFICGGTYQENLTVAGDTDDLWLVGAGRGSVTIQGTAASPTITVAAVGTGGVSRLRLEHLTIDHTGAQTLLYFNSVAGGIPTHVDLIDLRFVSGTVGIDMSDINGGYRFTLRDIIMESGVVDAGQLQVSDMNITNLKTYCTGKGLYISGATAATGIRISDSRLVAGSDYALRFGAINDLQMTNTRIVATGTGTKGILTWNFTEITLTNCILDIDDGIGIDVSGIGTALVIDGGSISCTSGQSTPRVGIYIDGLCRRVTISDLPISGFESYAIEFDPGTQATHLVLDGVTVINGGDTHSVYIGGWDYGTITGCTLVGTGGANTTYGVYGAAGTTHIVIVGNNAADGHDGMTNLAGGTDGNVVVGNDPAGVGGDAPNEAEYLVLTLHAGLSGERRLVPGTGLTGTDGGADGDYDLIHATDASAIPAAHHALVTLAADAQEVLNLSTQELGLVAKAANLVFAGPATGAAADPTFRSLVEADIPGAFLTATEHTTIGEGAPHHSAAKIEDDDADTIVDTERTADDDIIWFKSGGTDVGYFDNATRLWLKNLVIGTDAAFPDTGTLLFVNKPSFVPPGESSPANIAIVIAPDATVPAGFGSNDGLRLVMQVQPTAATTQRHTGLRFQVDHDAGAFNITSASALVGIEGKVRQNVAGSIVDNVVGVRALVGAVAGTITNARCFDARLGNTAADAGTIGSEVAFTIGAINANPAGGVTTRMGVDIPLLTGAGVVNTIAVRLLGGTIKLGPDDKAVIELTEEGSPATPAANILALYSKDISGVTGLAFKDSAGTETTLVARTRRMVMALTGHTFPVEASPRWDDAVTTYIQWSCPIPSDWVPGTNITAHTFLYQGSTAASPNAVLRSNVASLGDQEAWSWNIESAANADMGVTFDTMEDLSRTLAAASISAGEVIRWYLQRLGADAGDLVNAPLQAPFGAWIEYTAFF